MKTLIVATDLGRLRAYRAVQDFDDPSPTIETVREEDFEDRHSRVANRVTDQAGRFPSGNEGMSYGERHGESEEARQAQLRLVADAVNEVAESEPEMEIYFAAPQSIFSRLREMIGPTVNSRISKSLALDLVKVPKLDLLRRFEES